MTTADCCLLNRSVSTDVSHDRPRTRVYWQVFVDNHCQRLETSCICWHLCYNLTTVPCITAQCCGMLATADSLFFPGIFHYAIFFPTRATCGISTGWSVLQVRHLTLLQVTQMNLENLFWSKNATVVINSTYIIAHVKPHLGTKEW